MDKVRIGIIGLGGMGNSHASYLSQGQINGAELAAVADVDPARLADVQDKYGAGVQAFAGADALFAAQCVDAVIVATPHYFHPPLVIQALENGLHADERKAGWSLYAPSPGDERGRRPKRPGLWHDVQPACARRASKAKVAGCIRRTGADSAHHLHHQQLVPRPELLRFRRLGGRLGQVRAAACWPTNVRTTSTYGSGICGMPQRVRAFCRFGQYHEIEVEDDVTAYVEYENGATGVFITSTGEAPGTNRLEISADRGKVVLEDGKITFWRTTESARKFLVEWPHGFGSPEVWKCEVPGGGGEEHKGITQNWVQAIRTGSPLLAAGTEGINGVELANAMLLSTWTDDWVPIPVDEDLYYEELQKRVATSAAKQEGGRVMEVQGTF